VFARIRVNLRDEELSDILSGVPLLPELSPYFRAPGALGERRARASDLFGRSQMAESGQASRRGRGASNRRVQHLNTALTFEEFDNFAKLRLVYDGFSLIDCGRGGSILSDVGRL
jgi:hypothetical protein